MPVNVERLRALLEWAEEEQKRGDENQWCQSDWICGTTYCIAGKECLSLGYAPSSHNTSFVVAPDGISAPVSYIARKSLGIDVEDAERLFDGGNDIDDIRRIIGQIITR